jgi:3-hydroxy-9,10-secoandrosta-1,3,5(10)-triene-9,17-dione monooxygenase reductase component
VTAEATEAFDGRTFRQTVGHFATGVTVIAAEVDGHVRGMTANAFTSLSLDPPLVLFCCGKSAHMSQAIRQASRFSINMLSDGQQDISTYFAGAWKGASPPPFAFAPWDGAHRLEGGIAALNCAVETILEGGDHWIVIGRVLALHRAEGAHTPLLFFRGRYGRMQESESLV